MGWYDVDRVLEAADLQSVSRDLGIAVETKGSTIVALCPFHQDSRPSLRLFPADSSGPAHYHCFACNAHGTAIDLVKEKQGIDFKGAVEWLAARCGIPPVSFGGGALVAPAIREDALTFAADVFDRAHDAGRFAAWSAERGFEVEFLHSLGLRCILRPALIPALRNKELGARLALVDGLLSAGLLTRLRPPMDPSQTALDLEEQFRDYFHDGRVLIPINDQGGKIVGFAGRVLAAQPNDGAPKYLLSPSFQKGEHLFNVDRAREQLASKSEVDRRARSLYVVEGFIDALRLESLGLPAVALMGTSIGKGQLASLLRMMKRGAGVDGLEVRLFLDHDDAGVAGTARSVKQLIGVPGVEISWIQSRAEDVENGVKDPDAWLSGLASGEAREMLDERAAPGISALILSEARRIGVERLDQESWNDAPTYARERALFQVARTVRALSSSALDWRQRIAFSVQSSSPWLAALLDFLSDSKQASRDKKRHQSSLFLTNGSARANLAWSLAYHGSRRGELPCDEATWKTLNLGSRVFNRILLERTASRIWKAAAPFDAVNLPRKFTSSEELLRDSRRKVMPHPADLHLQQLLLNELLTERHDFVNAEGVSFSECIPAVRWYQVERELRVTGHVAAGHPSPVRSYEDEEATLSFGYQVDMEVLEGRRPPSDQGMYRPFGECWRDFMTSLGRQARRIGGKVYVLRLDAKRYYDSIQRYVIRDVLLPAVQQACAIGGAEQFEQLLGIGPEDQIEVPEAVVDLLCATTFGFTFRDPGDGRDQTTSATQGIPQGPVISAWLGTIAMFPVDAVARDFIRASRYTDGLEQRPRAGYARYVDDIVLFADSEHLLGELRELVQRAASRLNLILVTKGERVSAGSPEQVLMQLNEGRNLAAYLPTWEPPMSGDGEIGWGLGGDGPDVDRQSALRILRHPSLLDDPSRVDKRVADAMRAPDLRPADLGKCARLLWWQIAMEYSLQVDHEDADLWSRYLFKWSEVCAGHSWAKAYQARGYDVLFAIEGLDKLLDPDPWMERDQPRMRVLEHKHALAKLAETVLASGMLDRIDVPENAAHIQRRISMLRWKAGSHLVGLVPPPAMIDPHKTKQVTLIDWLCQAGGLLQQASGDQGLHPLRSLTDRQVRLDDDHNCAAKRVRAQLLPEQLNRGQGTDEGPLDAEARSLALDLLISLTPEAARWKVLETYPLLLGSTEKNLKILPSLPFSDGLVGIDMTEAPQVKRLTAFTRDVPVCPLVEFATAKVHLHGATVGEPLRPEWTKGPVLTAEVLSWEGVFQTPLSMFSGMPFAGMSRAQMAAALFESLHLLQRQVASVDFERVPVIAHLAVGNQVTADEPDGLDMKQVLLLSAPVESELLGVSAWIRDGQGRLRSTSVPIAFAPLWRIGWAVADALGVADDDPMSDDEVVAEDQVIEDFVVRQQLKKLRGRWSAEAQVQRLGVEGLPPTIQRTLAILRAFDPKLPLAQQVRLVLATEVESRSMALRLSPDAAGDLTSRLHEVPAQAIRRLPLSILELLALPANDDNVLRADLAFMSAFASRVCVDDVNREQGTFGAPEALRISVALATTGVALRGLVASLWGLARTDGEKRLDEFLSIPAKWPQPDAEKIDLQRSYSEMRAWLLDQSWRELSRATPLHWLLATIALLERTCPQALGLHSLQRIYGELLGWYGGSTDADRLWAWPFEGFSPYASEPWSALVDLATSFAIETDKLLGLSVRRVRAPSFRRHPTDDRFIDAESRQWVLSKVQYSSLGSPESVAREQEKDGARLLAVWTEVRVSSDGELLSVHQIDSKLGRLYRSSNGIDFEENRKVESTDGEQRARSFNNDPERGATATIAPAPSVASQLDSVRAEHGPIAEALTRAQTRSWTQQGSHKSPAHMRIALFQFRIDETYGHPMAEAGLGGLGLPDWAKNEVAGNLKKSGELSSLVKLCRRGAEVGWRASKRLPSWPELRRQRLLKRALDACSKLKVDLLVLPEVSVRPETVDWLEKELHHHPGLAVLAGTYRELNPSRLDRHLLAPTTLLWRPDESFADRLFSSSGHKTLRFTRNKKYRAVAAKEFFRPDWKPISPLFSTDSLLAQLRGVSSKGLSFEQVQGLLENGPQLRYCMELICSELFLMTSPANLPALREEVRSLLKRFPSSDPSEADIVREDYEALGNLLSVAANRNTPRRSILVVPAATTRSNDYWYAGQASVLASGTATVFCNAVASFACGGSCFIGLEATTGGDKDSAGVIGPLTPYHGWRKGIFLGRSGDALSKGDQALVVADVDPVHVVSGKPRPQLLPEPMALVAYLPVVELLDAERNAESLARALEVHFAEPPARGLKYVQQGLPSPPVSPSEFWAAFAAVRLIADAEGGLDGPELAAFAQKFGDPDAVRQRLLCWDRDRHQQCHPGERGAQFDPAWLDFLAVDLSLGAQELPDIEVPAWSVEASLER